MGHIQSATSTVNGTATLAHKDAWHAAEGYMSGQTMKRIDYHRETGEENRATVSIKKVREGLDDTHNRDCGEEAGR